MRNSIHNSFWKLALVVTALAVPGMTLAQGGGQAPPFAGASKMTLAEAVKKAPEMDTSLAPLAKAETAAAAKLKKSPKDAAAKKAYVEAAYKFGYGAEYSKSLSSPVKYRTALAMYRKALAVDPKHQASLNEKKQIEDIYKSMNMPVPTK